MNQDRRVSVESYGYWRRWGGVPVTGSVDVYDVNVGTLIVDLLDGDSEEGVWRGVAQKDLPPNPSPEKMEKKLRKILLKMFRNYPPD